MKERDRLCPNGEIIEIEEDDFVGGEQGLQARRTHAMASHSKWLSAMATVDRCSGAICRSARICTKMGVASCADGVVVGADPRVAEIAQRAARKVYPCFLIPLLQRNSGHMCT